MNFHHPALLYSRNADYVAGVTEFVRSAVADGAEELVLAASEVAANTIEHTGGGGTVAVWTEPGLVVCQLRDTGHLTDPLAGRIVPPDTSNRGFGLVLVNELCDLVRVHTSPAGTTIRLHKVRPAATSAPAGPRAPGRC